MSKITIEFDTSTKAMGCAIDGVPVPDVYSVNIYPRDYADLDEYSVTIATRTEDESRELTVFTSMSASEGLPESGTFVGFAEKRTPLPTRVARQIAEFLK